jgi:galactokinase
MTFPFFFIIGHIDFNILFILPFSIPYTTKLSTQD